MKRTATEEELRYIFEKRDKIIYNFINEINNIKDDDWIRYYIATNSINNIFCIIFKNIHEIGYNEKEIIEMLSENVNEISSCLVENKILSKDSNSIEKIKEHLGSWKGLEKKWYA